MDFLNRRMFVTMAAAALTLPTARGGGALAKDTPIESTKPRFAYVGSRTTKERKARGRGIEVYRILDDEAGWEPIQTVEGLTNPSFLIADASSRFIFTVHGDMSEISSFAIDVESGKLSKIGSADTRGKNPVHLVSHGPSKSLLVANYATGSVIRIPVSDDGKLGEAGEPLALPGQPGPHKTEQSSSHPHQIVADPTRKFFLVPDKGLDQIFTIGVDANGDLKIVSSVASRQGAGPRHLVFGETGRFAYVVNELDSTVTTYRYAPETGRLEALQIVSSVPPDFVGDNRAAAIVVSKNGGALFATNRGHNSVVGFAIDGGSGLLKDPQWHGTKGAGPRFASLSPSGKTLFVANELSDTVVSFSVSEEGDLSATDAVVSTGSPVSVVIL